jgi:hypothetical protein
MNIRQNAGLIFMLLFAFAACNRKESCQGSICTADYKMILVAMLDSNGNPFVPEKVETYDASQTLLNVQTDPSIIGQNVYTVADDSDLGFFEVDQSEVVTMKIYQSGAVVHQAQFEISRDCCHVQKVSGLDTLVL